MPVQKVPGDRVTLEDVGNILVAGAVNVTYPKSTTSCVNN